MNFSLMFAQVTTAEIGAQLFSGQTILLFAIAVPLAAALSLLVSGALPERFVRRFATFAAAVPAVAAIALWVMFERAGGGAEYRFYLDLPTGLENLGISLKLGLNGISLPMFALAGLVGFAAVLYAAQQDVERPRHYLTLILFMVGGLMGVFASIDVFFFYFFHEVALIPTFLLMIGWGGKGRRGAAVELAIYLTLGAMLSLLGLIALHRASGSGSFDLISLRNYLLAMPPGELVQRNIFGLLLFGFGILVSLWPFHSWAPRGYGAAPTPVAMLHAGVLKKFGLYGLVQIAAPLLPAGAAHWMPLLCWLALGNIIIIGLVTMSQRDLKQMVGFASVMHMGYLFLAVAAAGPLGTGAAVLLMFAHGLSTALMFLLANCVQQRTGTYDMLEMGGLAMKAPALAGFFAAAVLAAIGLPGFANFWGEFLVFLSIYENPATRWLIAPAVAGIVISAIYGLRAVARVCCGEETAAFQEQQKRAPVFDLTWRERVPALLLVILLALAGVFPRLVTDPIDRALTPVPRAEVSLTAAPPAPSADILSGN